jgi:hypothetical protein
MKVIYLLLLVSNYLACNRINLDIKAPSVSSTPVITHNCSDYDSSSNYNCLATVANLNNDNVVWTEVSDTCGYYSIHPTTGVISGTIPVGPMAACDYVIKAADGVKATANTTINLDRSLCPSGFISVDGNGLLGTVDFCVMKYEAKCSGSTNGTGCDSNLDVPVSQPLNLPWRSSVNAQISFDACSRMSESNFNGAFTLIATPEWMTIARDIEQVNANWSGGSKGIGRISVGHSDNNPGLPLEITNVNDPYSETGNNSAEADGSGWEQKRTLTLRNGSEIWDFAGNTWEWTDWSSADGVATPGPTTCAPGGWYELTNPASSCMPTDELQSLGGYDSSHGFGQWWGSTQGGPIRGGAYNRNIFLVGILAINLDANMASGYPTTSFRCVYIP